MSKYLTVKQYLSADEGLPVLDGDPDPSLIASYIKRAERAVDNFLHFDPRLGGFEPHTVWFQAPFNDDNRKTVLPTFPIPIRKVTRYDIQVANLTTGGNGQGDFAQIGPGDVAFNTFAGYIEILPLQALTWSLVPIFAPFGMSPPVVQCEYLTGYYLPVFGEVATDSGNHKIYELDHGFIASTYDVALSIQPKTFTPAAPTKVYVNGVLKTVQTDYTLDAVEGVITFTSALQATDVVTADYVYQIPDEVREATIAQTSFMLAQRTLNQFGMQGLTRINSDGQSLFRPQKDSSTRGLCQDAADWLAIYNDYPIG